MCAHRCACTHTHIHACMRGTVPEDVAAVLIPAARAKGCRMPHDACVCVHGCVGVWVHGCVGVWVSAHVHVIEPALSAYMPTHMPAVPPCHLPTRPNTRPHRRMHTRTHAHTHAHTHVCVYSSERWMSTRPIQHDLPTSGPRLDPHLHTPTSDPRLDPHLHTHTLTHTHSLTHTLTHSLMHGTAIMCALCGTHASMRKRLFSYVRTPIRSR